MSYRRRGSPLHAARAAAGCAYCASLAIASLSLSAPVGLGAVSVCVLGAGLAAGVGRELRLAAGLAGVLGVLVMAINALVTREGLTVIWRLGNLPLVGQTDITLEATVYGAILGLRAFTLILCGSLYTLAVDPDEVLRLFRRVSFRSALTATLATRMVPILLRDSHRLADAQRCRPGRPPSRAQIMRAATSGMLDRALDIAAALEVRGYGVARRPPRARRAWTRQDAAFSAAALAVLALVAAMAASGEASMRAYPSLQIRLPAGELAMSAALLLCGLSPFAVRRGMGR